MFVFDLEMDEINNRLEVEVQAKKHRKKRINKKWRKRYGTNTVAVDHISQLINDLRQDRLLFTKNRTRTPIDPEWENEPDHVDVMHDNYHFVILRNPHQLHLNGYIGIPKEHKWFGKNYLDDEIDIECHGGLTFSGNELAHMQKDFWYFGFDCAHPWDIIPDFVKTGLSIFPDSTYKNIQYVIHELQGMYEQLIAQ